MARKKQYTNFTLLSETCTMHTKSYADAFASYQKAAKPPPYMAQTYLATAVLFSPSSKPLKSK